MIELTIGIVIGLLIAIVFLLTHIVFAKKDTTPVEISVEKLSEVLHPKEKGGIISANSEEDVINMLVK